MVPVDYGEGSPDRADKDLGEVQHSVVDRVRRKSPAHSVDKLDDPVPKCLRFAGEDKPYGRGRRLAPARTRE